MVKIKPVRTVRSLKSHRVTVFDDDSHDAIDKPTPTSTSPHSREDFDEFVKRERGHFLAATRGDERRALERLSSVAAFRLDPLRLGPTYPLDYQAWLLIRTSYIHKFSKSREGVTILLDNVGSFNESFKKFRRAKITDDDIVEHAVFLMGYFLRHIDAREYPHGRIVRVFDLSGFKLKHVANVRALRLGLRITMLAERYFPERLQECLVINAHPFAIGVFNRLIRGLLHEATRKKFRFYADDDVLRELLRPDQLDWQNHTSPEEEILNDYIRCHSRSCCSGCSCC